MKLQAFVLGTLFSTAAWATSLTITVSGIGSGKLGNTSFLNAPFTFTLTTDTTLRVKPPCCETTDTEPRTPTTFNITGAGSGNLNDSQVVFVYPAQKLVGLAHYNDGDVIDLPNPAFANYDMTTSLGPISGVPSFLGSCPGSNCSSLFTSTGLMLTFSDVSTVTFNFVVGTAGPAPSTITLVSSSNPSILGQKVTLTAAVSPAAATGGVTFYDGVTLIGSAALSAGKAALTTALLASGTRSLKAVYRGDSSYLPSTSAALSQSVSTAPQSGFQTAADVAGVSRPRAVAVADFNEDGKPDLAVDNFDLNTVSVLLGNGDGTFQRAVTYPTQLAPSDVAVADFNGDGHTDIAITNGATGINSVSVLLGNGNGTFQPAANYAVGANPGHLAVADFNNDGIADIVAVNFSDNNISILLGRGDGGFRPATTSPSGPSPGAIAVADFNGDGRPDLVVVNLGKNFNVLLGNGDGTFQTPVAYAAGTSPVKVATGDFNADGRIDLAIANGADDTVSVLLGNGNGTFQPPVNYPAPTGLQSVAVGDFNGDGRADLVVADSGSNNVSVLLGNGNGTFQPAVSSPAGAAPVFVVVSDFNADGRADLAVADFSSSISVLLGAAPVVPPPTAPSIARVVNGASFADAGLSPGLIFTLGGVRMGPDTGALAQLDSTGRIATQVAGVQVLVDGVPAPLLFVRQDQINAVAPYALASRAGQPVKVQVIYNGAMGNIVTAPVVSTAPAIFPLGGGQGAIRNQDQSINGIGNPAVRGSFVSIYATGEGQTSPPGVDGQLVTSADIHPLASVGVTIGGLPAVVQFQGSTVFDGFLQVNALVPAAVASGTVPVVLTIGGTSSPAGTTMVVQ